MNDVTSIHKNGVKQSNVNRSVQQAGNKSITNFNIVTTDKYARPPPRHTGICQIEAHRLFHEKTMRQSSLHFPENDVITGHVQSELGVVLASLVLQCLGLSPNMYASIKARVRQIWLP
jgi:hypothetical protein